MKIGAMNKRVSTTKVVFALVFAFFFVFQIKLFAFSGVTGKSSKASKDSMIDSHMTTEINRDKSSVTEPLPPRRDDSQMMPPITCDRSHSRYDICSFNNPTVLDPTTSTFYNMGQVNRAQLHSIEKIRPYPKKEEDWVMTTIKEVRLVSGRLGPLCQSKHNVPALVINAGGYTGNFFHDINDGFVPLFITVNSIFPDQDFVLVVSEQRNWWFNKYAELLEAFTKHPIINMDDIKTTHCFPSVTVGLMSHGYMKIDPTEIPNSRSINHFQSFLNKAYSHNVIIHPSITRPRSHQPRLILVSRSGEKGRAILNQMKLKLTAEEEGFEVIIFEPKTTTPLRDIYSLINSGHAMVGVHGAALTHFLFLQPGSVFIQIVPIGTEWLSSVCFGSPAKDLGLEYMEYRIEREESSLVDKYGKDSMLIKDPDAFRGNVWSQKIMDKYLLEQNVKLNFDRFRGYLKMAYGKAKMFVDREG